MKKYFSLFLALVMLVTAIPFAAITASAADIKGDVDGKRGADTIDYIKIKLQVKFENLLTGVFRTAADFDGNGVVDSTDGLCAKLRLKQA